MAVCALLMQVRHVFSGAVPSGEATDLLADLTSARNAPSQAQAKAQAAVSEDILEALKRVADEQTSEIAHICRCAAAAAFVTVMDPAPLLLLIRRDWQPARGGVRIIHT